ncbi:hypothetical protein MP228_004474 [Amoeboaphelidium protococcarum]|nr:hypothetical protein MP228_004474 [Amoeboaphelidium protococcarum]
MVQYFGKVLVLQLLCQLSLAEQVQHAFSDHHALDVVSTDGIAKFLQPDGNINLAFPTGGKDWRSRSIYQVLTDRFAPTHQSDSRCHNLMEYCGGTFDGLRKNLDHIEAMGFNAIWISPIVKNTAGGYHGYYAQDFYSLNRHFGTAKDLKRLVQECHKRDIWVMLDVVANHVGGRVGFNEINPFNSSSQYHDFCLIKNYDNQAEVENCRIGSAESSLPDLNTENPQVAQELSRWIKWIVKEYDFDGIRIDTVKHVRKEFWPDFVRSSGVFSFGEVLHGDPAYVGPYQQYLHSLLNFPLYFTLLDVFQKRQSMWALETRWNQLSNSFKDVSVLGSFIDNHDFARFMHTTNDEASIQNALAYMMICAGIPIVYQGTEYLFNGGDDPKNRESMWPDIYHRKQPQLGQFFNRINLARKIAGKSFFQSMHQHLWTNDDFHVLQRNGVILCVTNGGNGFQLNRDILIPLKHDYVNVLDQSGNDVLRFKDHQQDGKHVAQVELRNGRPKLYVSRDLIRQSNSWKQFFD